jgi:uncharacterized coiled-coil protein SlyX
MSEMSEMSTKRARSANADELLSEKQCIEAMKRRDLQVALDIAGFAGIQTRDRRGNILSEIWTKFGDSSINTTNLLESDDIRNILFEQIKEHLSKERELLLDSEDPAIVCNWILDFANSWERMFRSRTEQRYDISQMIRSSMQESITEIDDLLSNVQLDVETVKEHITLILEDLQDTNQDLHAQGGSKFLSAHEAAIRFYFRNNFTSPIISLLAGKILQKRQVCNKAGAYSAKVQRNDVTREKDDILSKFAEKIESDDVMFERCRALLKDRKSMRRFLTDHTFHVHQDAINEYESI